MCEKNTATIAKKLRYDLQVNADDLKNKNK